jgi:hypothetical protein
MRTLRLALSGTASLILLGSLAGGALAQSDEGPLDPMRAGHFTGAWSETISEVLLEDFVWTGGPGYGESLGNETVAVMDASDPRISGMFTQVMGVRSFPIDPEADIWALAWTATVRIENEDGAWAGTFEGFNNETIPLEWYHLTGEGAYEGLTATMRWTGDSDSYEGIIIPGVPPDHPDPIAASAGGEAGEALPTPEALEPPVAATAATEEVMVESRESEDAAVEATEQPEAPADGDGDLSGTAVYTDGLRTWQYWEGDDTIYELEMSDPRANGTYTEWGATIVGNGYDGDSLRPSLVGLMEVTLANDEGTWTGVQSAVWDDDMGWRLTAWLAGEDAYEGLTLYLHAHRFPVYSTPEMEFDGVIFDGEPPVMLEAVSFPAE